MKVAKVIATTFAPRSVRSKTELTGRPLGYFVHPQNFTAGEDIIKLINFTLDIESSLDPGCTTDIVFVNNQIGWSKGDEFLDSLNGKTLNNGTIRVLHRENIGLSYGAYNHSFSVLGDEYDYYLFAEDDVMIYGDNYAQIGIESFEKEENCGFVAYVGISTVFESLSYDDAFHAHGASGLTTPQVLKHVQDIKGSLAYSKSEFEQDRLSIIKHGEIEFTNAIYKLGYSVIEIDKDIKLYEHTYDLMRGIRMPRYASLPVRLKYNTKKYLYQVPIIRMISESIKSI